MRKFGWVAAVVVAVLLASVVLGGCAKKQAATDEPIKIGVIAPLTGSLQFEGSQQLNGVKMAVDEVNAGLAPVIVQQVAEIVRARDWAPGARGAERRTAYLGGGKKAS